MINGAKLCQRTSHPTYVWKKILYMSNFYKFEYQAYKECCF